MSLELTPLDESALSPAVKKVASAAAPPPLRLMAARGMAPIPPADLVVALYQLRAIADDELKETAEKTARGLPDALLLGPLSGRLDARVLDFFAKLLVGRGKLLHAVLLNAATADETFADLASLCAEAELELIAGNEQRLLRHPAIIAALYLNPKTRMSTAMRALELAVRNGVVVEGIPAFEEVKAAIEAEGLSAAEDEAFDSAVAATAVLEASLGVAIDGQSVDPDAVAAAIAAAADAAAGGSQEDGGEEGEAAPGIEGAAATVKKPPEEKMLVVSKLSTSGKLRMASVGNAFARAILVRDRNRVIAMAAVRNPAVNDNEAEKYAANRALHDDVIRYISRSKQFTKRYSVKMNLCNNPKTPLQAAMGFLGHLTPKDLRTISRSKSVPTALAKAALGLIQKREAK